MMHALRFTVVILLIACAGCNPSGPKLAQVSGTVTWNGEPIPAGNISFFQVDGNSNEVGGTITNGKYDLGVPPGKCRVEIHASREKPGQKDTVMGLRAREAYIPIRYNSKTILTAEVQENSKNEFSFDLTTDPPAKSKP